MFDCFRIFLSSSERSLCIDRASARRAVEVGELFHFACWFVRGSAGGGAAVCVRRLWRQCVAWCRRLRRWRESGPAHGTSLGDSLQEPAHATEKSRAHVALRGRPIRSCSPHSQPVPRSSRRRSPPPCCGSSLLVVVVAMHFARVLCGAKKLTAITSKRGNKNFYKGRGAPAPGHHTKWGGYHVDAARVATITFAAPDLTGFAVRQKRRHAHAQTNQKRRGADRTAIIVASDRVCSPIASLLVCCCSFCPPPAEGVRLSGCRPAEVCRSCRCPGRR